jgi:hypothetical protein
MYQDKYLKYKQKYLELKGGTNYVEEQRQQIGENITKRDKDRKQIIEEKRLKLEQIIEEKRLKLEQIKQERLKREQERLKQEQAQFKQQQQYKKNKAIEYIERYNKKIKNTFILNIFIPKPPPEKGDIIKKDKDFQIYYHDHDTLVLVNITLDEDEYGNIINNDDNINTISSFINY